MGRLCGIEDRPIGPPPIIAPCSLLVSVRRATTSQTEGIIMAKKPSKPSKPKPGC